LCTSRLVSSARRRGGGGDELVSAEEVAASARAKAEPRGDVVETLRWTEDAQQQRLALAYKESQAEDARLSALAIRDD